MLVPDDVGGVDIFVDELLLVDVVEDGGDLGSEGEEGGEREAVGGDEVVNGRCRKIFKNHQPLVIGMDEVVYFDDVRMVELTGYFVFLAEAGDRFGGGGEGAELFEDDGEIIIETVATIDVGVGTLVDIGCDLVVGYIEHYIGFLWLF